MQLKTTRNLISLIFILGSFSCKLEKSAVDIPMPIKSTYELTGSALTQEQYYDKVLGALVGSAIGDAMGASTEMWHRSQIQKDYNYITTLTPALREKSAEGTWDHNLGSGTTTDDTRWKVLMAKYYEQHHSNLSPTNFAKFISSYYESVAGQLSEQALQNPDNLDAQLEKVNWIKEWHRVTDAYLKNSGEYIDAKSRFYGGEMSCAGMLYSPVFGLFSENPEAAYQAAYEHALFDLGYARDISALVAAMTNVALKHDNVDSILKVIDFVDPHNYKNSRLIGRLPESQARTGIGYVNESMSLDFKEEETITPPKGFPGSKLDWKRQQYIYQKLEESQMPISFHAGEIWQILITGMEYGEGDFEKSLQFIVNYGRDNDTVAAVAGMILGAKDGYKKLPQELKTRVLHVNKEKLGIDLEELARDLTLKG